MNNPLLEAKAKSDAIGYLLRKEFPFSFYARNWGRQKPRILSSGSSRGRPREDSESTILAVKEFENSLRGLPSEELIARYRDGVAEDNAKKEASYTFNAKHSEADFVFWAKISSWSVEEMVALSLNRDPRTVSWDKIKSHSQISSFVKAYQDRKMIVARAVQSSQLYHSTTPSIFIAWADRMGVEYPQGMKAEVQALGVQIGDWKSLYDSAVELIETLNKTIGTQKATISAMTTTRHELDRELAAALEGKGDEFLFGSQERTTLLKLIAAMAISGYAYKPKAKRNDATSDIQSDLDQLGIGLDPKTILKWLREACATIDPDNLP